MVILQVLQKKMKWLATTTDNLSSVPGSPAVEKRANSYKLSLDLYVCHKGKHEMKKIRDSSYL